MLCEHCHGSGVLIPGSGGRCECIEPGGHNEIPTIFVKRTKGKQYEVRGMCSRCEKILIHGLPDNELGGHRQSHCECWREKGYYIELTL